MTTRACLVPAAVGCAHVTYARGKEWVGLRLAAIIAFAFGLFVLFLQTGRSARRHTLQYNLPDLVVIAAQAAGLVLGLSCAFPFLWW